MSCFITWKELEKTVLRTTGIDQQLQSQFESEVSKCREIFRCILDVVLFLSERQLPFRGSTTELNNPNNGLFLGNMELLSGHNKMLKSHLVEVKKHQENNSRIQAHYLSPRSQNEFIDECSKVVLNAIVEEVKQALYYSIIVDGTPDVSHPEQITFILRYVNLNEKVWKICERLLRMEDCDKKGRDIAELICLVLKEHDIEFKNSRGQGYDNGANMAGIYNGAQAVILEKNPQALFSSFSAHSLNLCGVHGAESSAVVKSFWGNIQRLYTLFSSSPSRNLVSRLLFTLPVPSRCERTLVLSGHVISQILGYRVICH